MVTRMLTFEVASDRSEIIVHGDVESIRSLAKRLEMIATEAESQTEGHLHLFSENWMHGGDLTKDRVGPESPGTTVADHVKVYCWGSTRSDVPAA
jgi:hypothetical protein